MANLTLGLEFFLGFRVEGLHAMANLTLGREIFPPFLVQTRLQRLSALLYMLTFWRVSAVFVLIICGA